MALEWLALLLIGLGTGVLGVIVGAGGGFILSPILLSFFGLPPATVAGTSLALVSINSISGGFTYWKLGLVDRRSGILFALAAIPGSVIAPFFITKISSNAFQITFGIILLLLSLQIALRTRSSEKTSESATIPQDDEVDTRGGFMRTSREVTTGAGKVYRYRFNEFTAIIFNFVLGFVSSFFGTGGGFIRTPILVNVFAFPVEIAVATSIFALAFVAPAGTISHIVFGNVQWFPTFVFAGIGLVIGGQIGARLTSKIRGAWILRLLLIVLVVLGIRLLVQGFGGG